MVNHGFKEKLRVDLGLQVASLLREDPSLTTETAIAKISQNMLKNNPFVPPEGDKCPIQTLPDELLVYLFETGREMEIEAMQFGEDDDDDYVVGSDLDSDEDEDESDEDEEGKKAEVVIEGSNGEDEADWSDVDDEDEANRKKKKRKAKNKNGDDDDDGDDEDEDYGNDDDDDDSEDYDDLEEPSFQVLVSHVCRRWRSIALDTPSLWTLIYFEKGTSLDKHRTFIERAKNAPLAINIDCTYDDTYDEDINPTVEQNLDKEILRCLERSLDLSGPSLPGLFGEFWNMRANNIYDFPEHGPLDVVCYTISELSEILDLIIPRVQYWQALCVSVSNYRWMYLLLARLHHCGPAEILEAFELYHHDDNDTGEFFYPSYLATKFTPFRGQAPRLRNCSLWGVHLDWDASSRMLNKSEDIELAYHVDDVRPSYDTFRAILERSNISALTLCLSGPRGTEDDWRGTGAQPFQIPSLQTLTLRYHSPQYACSLLRFLDIPNIVSLALDFDEEDYTDFAKDLCKASHGRSKSLLSGLENFKVSGLPCGRGLVHKILDQLVNLKLLYLNCTGEGEMFFEALLKGRSGSGVAEPTSANMYCPALETIQTSGISGKQMKEFVEVRSKAGVPVKKILMSGKDEIDAMAERWLTENVKVFEYFDPSDSEEEVFEDVEEIDDEDGDDVDDDF